MSRSIVITGGSIAGCAAAWWLTHHGFLVTVVEKAKTFRDGGQNVDIRGAGREIIRRMGLEEQALGYGTGEKGTAWINEDGEVVASFMTDELGTDGCQRRSWSRTRFRRTCSRSSKRRRKH